MAHKTTKKIMKRFVQTATGTILRRKAGQDHFNARESGTVTRRKRRDVTLTKGYRKTIKQMMGR